MAQHTVIMYFFYIRATISIEQQRRQQYDDVSPNFSSSILNDTLFVGVDDRLRVPSCQLISFVELPARECAVNNVSKIKR